MEEQVDVLVVGAGQAGLAVGYYLKQAGISHLIVDKAIELGESWKTRYDSLTLFTPRRYSSLPGWPMEGRKDGYPTKDEVAQYLQKYAERFSLRVRLNTEIIRLEREGQRFRCITESEEIKARRVIVATGPFQQPSYPEFAREASEAVVQLHSSGYRNASQLQTGSVLVVGGGNSGAQIAAELAAAPEREVYLSAGHRMKVISLEWAGRSVFWWLDKLGVLRADAHSFIGRRLRRMDDPIFGRSVPRLAEAGALRIKPRLAQIRGGEFYFADGTRLRPDNVIWATGFRSDYSWLALPGAVDDSGRPVHDRGISLAVPHLYYIGLPWQVNRASALLAGVGRDAESVVNHLLSNPVSG
ncbi:NAD(P)/FAD-dependent oxidoreductase [Paenibacillus sp. J2TS4]|uniref:flavin-containing monooxygenase n=1 Tax=Paenibacillus sp. J2TS4 TaxID=2807194 RepID=UPI001B0CF5EF|nr:NAD(P)-binding domain-containing protein [Paenibacillus sp. J2TS4]GIP31321.1 putative oxidoreductase CzcO [Paenibacillus sp. J2TS4]